MRLAWCTPFHRQSSIGRVSGLVVDELLKSAEVDIWRPPTAEPLDTRARCIELEATEADAARLATYDLAFYCLGNHVDNHRAIYEAARRTPGVIVLHDLTLHEFFAGYYLGYRKSREQYIAAIERWYGKTALPIFGDVADGVSGDVLHSAEALRFPLFEEAVAGAYGVVTHSEFAAKRVAEAFPGMIRALSLPFDDRKQRFRIPPRESLVPPGRLLAVTVGDVNPNKRIRQWLQVLRQNRHLSDRLLYVVVGDSQSDHGAELAQLSVEYGLGDMVRFTGYATEEQLAAWLTHADFCVNLRFPNTEAASGSAIEQLAYGKPLIVSDTGFYSELPNDCVLKVRVDREADDLAAAAERLVSNAQLRQAMSARARTYARETFRADRYAEGIQDFAAGVLDAKPLLAFADRVAVEIGRMGGNSSESLVSTVAAISSRLFGK